MMRLIIISSLRFRYILVAASMAMIVIGGLQLRDTRVDVFPEFAPPRVEVQTDALGLSAQEVEELVTVPLEQGLTGMPGLETLRSKSIPQQSSIELIFEKSTDVHRGPAPGRRTDPGHHADPAELGHATPRAAAAVGDKPGDEDRRAVRLPRPHRAVDDRAIQDSSSS